MFKNKKKIIKKLKKENKELKLEILKLQRDLIEEKPLIKCNNELRCEIIEKAKLFVKKNIKPNTEIENWNKKGAIKGFKGFKGDVCLIPYFTVDKENKKMRLILKGVKSGKVKSNLLLKCSKNDVFNEYIGKAILIGRAKGLNVSEFENCVQPDEIVLGMEVMLNKKLSHHNSIPGAIRLICKPGKYTNGGYQTAIDSIVAENSDIYNDTNAIYEVK